MSGTPDESILPGVSSEERARLTFELFRGLRPTDFEGKHLAGENVGIRCDWKSCYQTVDTNWRDEWGFGGGIRLRLGGSWVVSRSAEPNRGPGRIAGIPFRGMCKSDNYYHVLTGSTLLAEFSSLHTIATLRIRTTHPGVLMPSVPSQHYSGILVVTLPGRLDDCIHTLEGRAGVTVSIRDPDRDRMIVVLEASSRDALEALHRTVCALPGVVTADPVVHYVDDRPEETAPGI